MDFGLASSILQALKGREPTLARLSDERMKRLLKPLLSAIDGDVKTHRLTHDWPTPVSSAAKFRRTENRLDAYLKYVRRSPRHAAFRAIYKDWIDSHREMSQVCRPPASLSAEQITADDGHGNRRVSPLIFSTIWAIECSNDEGLETPSILGLIGHVDEMLATRSDGSTADSDGGNRELVKKAQLEGQRRGERVASQRLAKAEEHRIRINAELTEERKERGRLEKESHTARSTNVRIASELDQARRQASQVSSERDSALGRIQRIREVLKEERGTADARIADLSDELRLNRLTIEDLNNELGATPSGPPGLFELLNREIEKEGLKRDTTQGKTQISARQSYAKLKRIRNDFLAAYPELEPDEPPHHKPVERKAGFRVTALGGGTEIGASCYLLELSQSRVLIDCGIKVQERDISRLGPDLTDLAGIQAVVITHAHTDHVGWLPALIALDYEGDIYCTKETSDLLSIMLQDSRKQLERLMAIETLQARHTDQVLTPEPYSRRDVERVILRLRAVGYDVPVPLSPELSFSFLPAGHILGAASVQFEGGGRRIFFTGDFSTFAQETVFGAKWPVDGPGFDLVVSESTYGHRNREPRDDAIKALVSALQNTITRGGTAIIPSFALGRAQEVLKILIRAMKTGELDTVPVWIDGMTQSIDFVYQKHGRIAFPENFHHVRNEGFTQEDVISKAQTGANIIVSTSGMLSGGPVVQYASRLLQDGRNRLFFCGYQDEEQPGAKLLRLSNSSKAHRRVTVQDERGEEVEIIAAAAAQQFHLSAHSDQAEIVGALTALKPRHIMLVHGDDEARQGLFKRLSSEGLPVSLGVQYEAPPA